MRVGAQILSHITDKKSQEHFFFLEKEKSLHKLYSLLFLVPCQATEHKQKQANELGSNAVHCIFTFFIQLWNY